MAQSSDPRCWWCHIPIDPDTGYRGSAPELALPAGMGVIVCTPACPHRPEGARVWRRDAVGRVAEAALGFWQTQELLGEQITDEPGLDALDAHERWLMTEGADRLFEGRGE